VKRANRIARCGAIVVLPMLFAGMIAAQSAANWTRQNPSTSPIPTRAGSAMAYDSAHNQIVLFGGGNGRVLNETWNWDGSDWTRKLPLASPPGRVNHAMAYDSAHGQIVLFGGRDANGRFSDTWVWDGTNWTQKFPQTSPPARAYTAMVYDSAHGQVVLFGGSREQFPLTEIAFNDTWTWDGSNWTQRSPQSSPAVRGGHALAYDSAHGQVVLFGGDTSEVNVGNTFFSDTWTWDGANWTQKSPQSAPSARSGHAMAYDSSHGQVVLYGGYGAVGFLGDIWTWDAGGGGTTPQINAGGIVNNASYNLGSDGSSVAPGSIAAIFGSNLTDGSSCLPPTCNPAFGSNGKLHTAMAGAQVTIGATAVPIFYATPTQLGIQIPFELAGGPAQVAVSVAGRSSTATTANVATVAPGIFTYTADGKGAGAITHVDGSAVTTQSPAQPGELVILYATGLGPVMPAVPTGALPAGTSSSVSQVMLNIGGIGVIPDFAGLAGCCVGLNQINARVPAGVSRGNAVPVVLTIGGKSSNTATIAVQ
jgi:uncharacterized protein (TIGR03437 family)